MAEYKLSYTANEINEKLGKVDRLVSTVNGVAPDANGNVEIAGGTASAGTIDVVELPTENINEGAFCRLITARFVLNGLAAVVDGLKMICKCVNTLPEVGEVCLGEMAYALMYYSLADGGCYAYLDDALGADFGTPAGWYPISALCEITGVVWGGVITDINDCPNDGTLFLLVNRDLYTYKKEWVKPIMAYETIPKEIWWDGDMTDRTAFEISSGMYLVKVSDEVISIDETIGATVTLIDADSGSYNSYIAGTDLWFNDTAYTGAWILTPPMTDIVPVVAVVYSEEDFATALGISSGIYTNGVYFLSDGGLYVSQLTSIAPDIIKIDGKYLDLSDVSMSYNDLLNKPTIYTDVIRYTTAAQNLSSTYQANARANIDVYSKSEVDTKIANAVGNVDLTEYAKTTDVETMIANAIGSAIGGSY